MRTSLRAVLALLMVFAGSSAIAQQTGAAEIQAILIGNGDGTFAVATSYDVGQNAHSTRWETSPSWPAPETARSRLLWTMTLPTVRMR